MPVAKRYMVRVDYPIGSLLHRGSQRLLFSRYFDAKTFYDSKIKFTRGKGLQRVCLFIDNKLAQIFQ